MVKLYHVPRRSLVVLPCGTRLRFHHIDGMYSYCESMTGEVVHLAAWTEVIVLGALPADPA